MGMRARQQAIEASAAQQRVARLRTVVAVITLSAAGALLAIFALPVFLIVFGGMLPTMVAYFLDEQPGRYLFRAVAAMNFAGVVPFLDVLWRRDDGLTAALEKVGDLNTWFVMYGAAGVAWLLVFLLPSVTIVVQDALLGARLARLEAARQALVKEWGLKERG
jgi:hypothetical protein